MKNYPLKDWIPHQLIFGETDVLCSWLYLADKKFTEPFFEQTTSFCQSFDENNQQFKSFSTFDGLIKASSDVPYIEPTAFIFHISRCGSTLLTQMLSLDEKNIVISEAKILDAVIKYFFSFEDKRFDEIFKSFIRICGKKRFDNQENFFVKLDAWHIFFYDKLRDLYPNTPFIFTFRKPNEVINSQMNLFGNMIPQELFQFQHFGFEIPQIFMLPQEDFIAKVLERFFEELLQISEFDKNSLFLNYADGVLSNLNKTKDFVKISFSKELDEQIFERSKFHSKNPNTVFTEKPLTDEVPIYQQKVNNLYQKILDK
ncbi:MAG: hypothetical protein MUC29_07470 [Pyrinomonadaceae bacterium]|nr:hypothetical protein [Pyrinomonadaceae bacterium]